MYINHISVSRKDVFTTCEQKYKFRYHLKIKSPDPEPYYFTYGNIVHKAAEEYVRHKGEISLGEIANQVVEGKILLENFDSAPPAMPIEYKRKFKRHLEAIGRLTEKIGFSGELEYPFEHDLDPPNSKLFVGLIDRLITSENGTYLILDYKTTKKGRYQKTTDTIRKDLQLRCYSKAVQKQFNVPADKIQAALFYADGVPKDGNSLLRVQFSQKSLDSAEEELLTTYNRIVEKDPRAVRGSVGHQCSRCEYKSLCPFLKVPNLPPTLQ